jgi:Holliday junction resolvase
MAAKSRSKGKRGEREIVTLAHRCGLQAERTWASAQSSDPLARKGDVTVAGMRCQVKLAANGWRTLYEAMEGVKLFFLRADRERWLVLMDAEELLELLAAEGRKVADDGK